MDNIIGYLNNLNAGNIWVGFLALAVALILKKEPFKIFTHLSEIKTKDVEQASTLLGIEFIGDESKGLIGEYIENFAFKKYYGINAYSKMRSALLAFHTKHQGKVEWLDLRRAYRHITLEEGRIKINLNRKAQIERWFVTAVSWFIGFYSLLIIAVAIVYIDEPFKFMALSTLSIVLLVSSVTFSFINFPYHSAVKIKNILREEEKQNVAEEVDNNQLK